MIELCGWFSSICFAVCGVPQAILSFRQKHSDGVSWLFLILWILGEISGSVYAIDIGAYPLLLNYVVSFVCACVIVYYKIFSYVSPDAIIKGRPPGDYKSWKEYDDFCEKYADFTKRYDLYLKLYNVKERVDNDT